MARLEQCGGEVGGRLGRVEVLAGVPAEVDAFLGGRERELHVPRSERGGRTAGQSPHQRVTVAQQASRLDPTVEQLAGLGQLAALAPYPAQDLDQDEELLPLAGRPRDGQGAIGMRVCVRIPIHIELHAGEERTHREVAGEFVVRQRIEERRRL